MASVTIPLDTIRKWVGREYIIGNGEIRYGNYTIVPHNRIQKKLSNQLGIDVSMETLSELLEKIVKGVGMGGGDIENEMRDLFVIQNGNVQLKKGRKTVNRKQAFKAIVANTDIEPEDVPGVVERLFDGEYHRQPSRDFGGFPRYDEEEDLVAEVAEENGWDVTPTGIWYERNRKADNLFSMSAFKIAAHRYNRSLTKEMKESGWYPIDVKLVPEFVSSYAKGIARKKRTTMRDHLAYETDDKLRERGERDLEDFVRAINVSRKIPDEVILVAIRQWIWQVKRKIWGYSADNHLVLIAQGVQGSGKSTAMKKLCGPLKQMMLDMTVDKLQESSIARAFAQNYIVFLDELAGLAKADENMLKKFITAEFQTMRHLFSHDYSHEAQNCSVIGTSNYPIKALFRDATGMRRYFEIPTAFKIGSTLDWETINALDYTAIWRSVDEEKDRGPFAACSRRLWDAVTDWQEKCRPAGFVELFLSSQSLQITEVGEYKYIPTQTLLTDAARWARETGIPYHYNILAMVQDLQRIGCVHVDDEENGGAQWIAVPLKPTSDRSPYLKNFRKTIDGNRVESEGKSSGLLEV